MIYLATFLYAIVGGPGVGKTSIIEELKKRDEYVIREVATDYIAEQLAEGVKEPWGRENFQRNILVRHLAREAAAVSDACQKGRKHVFSDRGMLDNYVYMILRGREDSEEYRVIDRMIKKYHVGEYYDAVFFVSPYNGGEFVCEHTEIRHEDTEESMRIHEMLRGLYVSGCKRVIEVPFGMTPEARAEFVLDQVNQIEKERE